MSKKRTIDHSKLETIPIVHDLSPPPPDLNWPLIFELRDGVMRAAIFHAALEFAIFTYLWHSEKGMTSGELAAKLNLNPRATEVLLDCVTGLKLLHKDRNGRYSNTREAVWFLVEDSPYFIGLRPPCIGSKYPWESFLWTIKCSGQWRDLLTEGKVVPIQLSDSETYANRCRCANAIGSQTYYARNALRGHIHQTLCLLKEQGITTGANTLLDLGGGHGLFALAFARAVPGLRVRVYELSDAAKLTRQFLEAYGAQDSVEVIEGNMLVDSIPGCYDIVFCSNLLFDLDDMGHLAAKILRVLNPGGWVIWKLFFPPHDWSEFFVTYLMFVYDFLQKSKANDYQNPPVATDVLRLMEAMKFESPKILGVVDNQATICIARKPTDGT